MLELEKSPVWRWYRRHDDVINLILTSTAELLPFGTVITKAIDFIGAGLTDQAEAKEEAQEEQAKQLIATLLIELKPHIISLVEEITYSKHYQQKMTVEEFKKTVLTGHVKTEFDQILPRLKKSMSQSIEENQQRVILDKRYELGEEIGKGAQGVVYKGRHLLSDNIFAIKLLPVELNRDARAITKIRTEFNNMVNHLRHQFIVAYTEFAFDKKTGQYFLVMDYIKGQTLADFINNSPQPFNIIAACQALLPIAEALDFSHKKGFVHQDIKPANILINEQGDYFLTDFGLARKISHTLTTLGQVSPENICGSRPYMAPEQYRGENPKAAADNWAFGVVLYEMLAGEMPFNAMDFMMLKDIICNETPAKITGIDLKRWQLLLTLLAKERSQRPESLSKFLKELMALEMAMQEEYIDQYVIYQNGTVLDTNTNLMWKRCPEGLTGEGCCQGVHERYDFDTAVEKFKNIHYAGYSDWRLPTIKELNTLVYCSNGVKPEYKEDGYQSTKDCNDGDKDYQRPTINQQVFPNTVGTNKNNIYWSSSPYVNYSNDAWGIYFANGYDDDAKRSSERFVRLVRVGQ